MLVCDQAKNWVQETAEKPLTILKTSSKSALEQVIYTYGAQANSAFHPSMVSKSSTSLFGWGAGGMCSLVSGGR